MNHVNAHVARPRDANQRVHVGAVHVHETSRVMNDATNLLDVFLKQAEGVRIRQHQSGHVAMRAEFAQVIEVRQSFRRRSNCLDGEA